MQTSFAAVFHYLNNLVQRNALHISADRLCLGKKNTASLRACCNAYCTPDSVPMINSLSGLSFANCMMPLVEPM